jgi:ankyrin repeat protein
MNSPQIARSLSVGSPEHYPAKKLKVDLTPIQCAIKKIFDLPSFSWPNSLRKMHPIAKLALIYSLRTANLTAFLTLIDALEDVGFNFNKRFKYPKDFPGEQRYLKIVQAAFHDLIYKLQSPCLSRETVDEEEIPLITFIVHNLHSTDFQLLDRLLNIDGVNPNIFTSTGHTALHLACKMGKLKSVESLLRSPILEVNLLESSSGSSSLEIAVSSGELEIIDALINDQRTDVNLENLYGLTPLHTACQRENFSSIDRLLSSPKVNVNISSPDGISPLSISFQNNNLFLSCILLNHCKDANLAIESSLSYFLKNANNNSLVASTLEELILSNPYWIAKAENPTVQYLAPKSSPHLKRVHIYYNRLDPIKKASGQNLAKELIQELSKDFKTKSLYSLLEKEIDLFSFSTTVDLKKSLCKELWPIALYISNHLPMIKGKSEKAVFKKRLKNEIAASDGKCFHAQLAALDCFAAQLYLSLKEQGHYGPIDKEEKIKIATSSNEIIREAIEKVFSAILDKTVETFIKNEIVDEENLESEVHFFSQWDFIRRLWSGETTKDLQHHRALNDKVGKSIIEKIISKLNSPNEPNEILNQMWYNLSNDTLLLRQINKTAEGRAYFTQFEKGTLETINPFERKLAHYWSLNIEDESADLFPNTPQLPLIALLAKNFPRSLPKFQDLRKK